MNKELISGVGQSMELVLPVTLSMDELRHYLTRHINHLINHDFDKLVHLLYRIDVDERKLRHLLQEGGGENAAGLIADLVIERQLQKLENRDLFKPGTDIPEEEKW